MRHFTYSGRSLFVAALFLSTASAAYAADAPVKASETATVAAEDSSASDSDGSAIVVTARNRKEDVNNVPIPVSVLSAGTLTEQHVFDVNGLTERVPGLTATTPNARRSGISLRGVGKTSGNDNMEAAVGVIVDDVFLDHVGMTYQDFTDLDQVEVLHGPQGTLLGKNTSMGVIKYTTKAPSFTPEGSFELEGGLSTRAVKSRGSFSDALVADTLAVRASYFVDEQQGDLTNIDPAVGGHWHGRNRWGGRLKFLWNAASNLTATLNLDYANVRENSNTKPFMFDPANFSNGTPRTTSFSMLMARSYFGGYQPVIGSWNTIDLGQAQPVKTINYGGSLVLDWKPGSFDITSITAARKFHFDANNDSDQTRFDISVGGTLVNTTQYSQEFRVSAKIAPTLDFQSGVYLFHIDTETTSRTTYGQDAGAFYATNAQYAALYTPALLPLLQQSLAGITTNGFQHPISDSVAGFGQLNWKPTSEFTLTGGFRYTYEHKTSYEYANYAYTSGAPLVASANATANAIRAGQLKSNFAIVDGVPIKHGAIAWLINPSYKLNQNLLLYASGSYGEKSGAVSFTGAKPTNVNPERTLDFEAGIKGQFFDHRLSLNANLYYTRVHDYQAQTYAIDPTLWIGVQKGPG